MVSQSDISSDCSDGSTPRGQRQPWGQQEHSARARWNELASTPSASGDNASETSSGGDYPGPLRWRVVWCHERCHKRESEDLRRELGEACRAVGASLVCLKKAGKFADWLHGGQRNGSRKPTPYVLVSDWREAKPCMDFLARDHPSSRPLLTVLLCDERRHFERASTWAHSLPPRPDPVQVQQDIDGVKKMLAWAAQTVLPVARSEPWDKRCSRAPLEQRPRTGYNRGAIPCKALPTQAAAPPALRMPVLRMPMPTEMGTIALTAGVLLPIEPMQDLVKLCGTADPLEMERVLKAAMPAHYED